MSRAEPDDEPLGSGALSLFPALATGTSLLLIAAIIAWAGLTNVDMIVEAPARIIPEGHAQIIQHYEGGILENLAVKEGDYVRKGDVLAKLSDIGSSSTADSRRIRIESLRARVMRLRAEADGTDMPPAPPGAAAHGAYASEQELFASRRWQLEKQRRVQKEDIASREAEIAYLGQRRASLLREVRLAGEQLKIILDLQRSGSASQLEILNAKSKAQQADAELGEVEAQLPRAEADAKKSRAQLDEISASFIAAARNDLGAAETELAQLLEESRVDTDRLGRAELRSPVNGVVNRLYITTTGGVLTPGAALMEITPLEGRVAVEANVLPQDRGLLRVDLPAQIKLTAYDYSTYGAVLGKVREISADSLASENGARTFRVRIGIDEQQLKTFGKPILPGMTANVSIAVGERRVLSFLLSPIRLFADAALREPR